MSVQTVNQISLPDATKKRLSQIEELLKVHQAEKITSALISSKTGWKDSLIRHDLWLLRQTVPENLFHGISNGYQKEDLLQALKIALGSAEEKINVCIAGLGRLGAALLDEAFFEGSQFVIKAGFDSNVNRVEILRSTFPLYPAGDMNWVIRQEKIKLAVLAVSDQSAQSMTDKLLNAGITGIVNMTRSVLKVPDGIKVENISVVNSLKLLI